MKSTSFGGREMKIKKVKCSRCGIERKLTEIHELDHCVFEKAKDSHYCLAFITEQFYLCKECYIEFLKFMFMKGYGK